MNEQGLARVEVIEKITAGVLSQREGAAQLGLTTRHLRRLQRQYQQSGPSVLALKDRGGQPSNNRISEEIQDNVLKLLEEHYPDFKPTFAHEKLTEQHGLSFSVEWLRQFMMKHGRWKGKRAKPVKIHQSRARRAAKGELVQIDGSPHDWFEGRAPHCCLIVFVDDATGLILALHFSEQETTEAYFKACEQHLRAHGRPQSYYSDKFGVFRVNAKEAQSGSGETQFGRAMRELGIKLMCANSPQAKGRVEKMNGTLQDRLIKEMRLRNISDISTANAFLPEFIQDYNYRFGKVAACPEDAHRKSLPDDSTLGLIFSEQHQRKLSKQLQISYKNTLYQVQMNKPSYRMRGAAVTVCERREQVTLIYQDRVLNYTTMDKANRPAPIATRKEATYSNQTRKPKAEHPWKLDYQVFDAVG